jgi:urea transport system permease protein
MDVVIGQLFTGLSIGSILLLAALGLSLTFGQMGVINMAHGEFIMAGSYTAYVVQQVISKWYWYRGCTTDPSIPCW